MSRYTDIDALINRLDAVDYGMKLPKAVVGLTKALLEDAPTIKTKQIKYFDEDEKVWKIGSVIIDSAEG